MASLFFEIMRGPYANKQTSWVTDTMTEENEDSIDGASIIAAISSDDETSNANSQPQTLKERASRCSPLLSSRNNKTQETLDEPGYDVVLHQIDEWTDAGGPTEKVDAEHAQSEESPRTLAVSDWTYIEEMRMMGEEKWKLAERVKELEAELREVVRELREKAEQISKLIIDHDEKELKIEVLEEENERIRQAAARDKLGEFLKIQRLSEEAASKLRKDVENLELLAKQVGMVRSQAGVADLESVGAKKFLEKDNTTLAIHNDSIAAPKRQKPNLTPKIQELKAESQDRATRFKLQSAIELAKTESEVKLARPRRNNSETLEDLKKRNATLAAQCEELRGIAKINEQQNSTLLVQLGQKSDDDYIVYNGNASSASGARRMATGPILVEHAVRTVKALNDTIYQFAVSLTDYVNEIQVEKTVVKQVGEESDNTTAALETLKSLLGSKIYTQLEVESRTTKNKNNPFVLQVGFQACLTACCMHIITSWDPAEPDYGKFLEVVYERIGGSGGPEKVAQWRKRILQNCTFSTKTGRAVLSNFITANLYAMLSISGWPRLGETTKLLDNFSGKLSEIVNLAVRVNELEGETTILGDLRAITVEEGADYMSQEMAVDSRESKRDIDGGRCMCGICVRARKPGHHDSDGGHAVQWDIDIPTPYSHWVVVACVGFGLKWCPSLFEAHLVLKPRVIVQKV